MEDVTLGTIQQQLNAAKAEGEFQGLVLQSLSDIKTSLTETRGELKDQKTQIAAEIEAIKKAIAERATKAEVARNMTRIENLENWRWYAIGIGSAVVVVGGLVANKVSQILFS